MNQGISEAIPLEAENQSPSHILISEGRLLLRCLWLTSSVEDRESFSSRDDMWCTELSLSCSIEIDDTLYLREVSYGISGVF